MRRLRLALVLLVLLVACAPRVASPTYPPAQAGPGVLVVRDASGAILLNGDLGLMAPPGSTLLFQRYLGQRSQSRFTAPQAFDRMLAWLKSALAGLGWRVVRMELLEEPPRRYQAVLLLAKGKERRTVRLAYHSGVYDLEVGP